MFNKRSEGNYNKQENNSKNKGNEPGFWENLKALIAENKKAKEREYLHDSNTPPLPQSAPPKTDNTDETYEELVFNTSHKVGETEQADKANEAQQSALLHTDDADNDADSIISSTHSYEEPEFDYIDFDTETSETDIYSRTFRYSDSADSIDSSEAELYIETSDLHFHTPSLEEDTAKDSTPIPSMGTSTDKNAPKAPKTQSAFLLEMLFWIVVPYIATISIFIFTDNGENHSTFEQKRENKKREQKNSIIAEQKKITDKYYNKDTRTLTLPKTHFAGNEYALAANDVKTIRSAGVVSTIGDNAFGTCQELETVNIRCKIIGKESFKGCASLRTAIIPRNLNWLRQEAFANCPQLETVLLSTTLSQIEDNVFLNSNNIREVSIPNNIKTHFFLHLSHCRKINTIYLLSLNYFKMPKSIKDAPIKFSKCKLYVPDSNLEQFRNNADWSRFGQILPLSQSRWFDAKGWGKE